MGLFTKLLGGILKNVVKRGKGNKDIAEALDSMQSTSEMMKLMEAKTRLSAMITEIMPYSVQADESYQLLLYEGLDKVPAIDLYDGNYQDRLFTLQSEVETATSISQLDRMKPDINQVATEIQTYLNEETSDLEHAQLWDAKFVKGVIDHTPPHMPKESQGFDNVMSEVMRAFRNWSSFAQAAIDLYGSQRLINATYEAVLEGEDPMEYMNKVLDLNQRLNSMFGGQHETISVPYAGFFGGGFFF